jgi:hypothetical protein
LLLGLKEYLEALTAVWRELRAPAEPERWKVLEELRVQAGLLEELGVQAGLRVELAVQAGQLGEAILGSRLNLRTSTTS